MIFGVKLWQLAADSCFPRVWLRKHHVQCGWWVQGAPPFLVVTRESQSPCAYLLWVNPVQLYSAVTMVLFIWGVIGNRVLLGFPFFSQYALAFIPSVELLVAVKDCWCFRGGHKKRCVKCHLIEAHCVCAIAQKAHCSWWSSAFLRRQYCNSLVTLPSNIQCISGILSFLQLGVCCVFLSFTLPQANPVTT